MTTKNNIEPLNADGVHELMLIASALKNAKHFIEDNKRSSSEFQIDEALTIVDKIIEEGFDSL